jgi:hypothetical protein
MLKVGKYLQKFCYVDNSKIILSQINCYDPWLSCGEQPIDSLQRQVIAVQKTYERFFDTGFRAQTFLKETETFLTPKETFLKISFSSGCFEVKHLAITKFPFLYRRCLLA